MKPDELEIKYTEIMQGWRGGLKSLKLWQKIDEQAYKQIVAILEYKVSDEWIEEKAGELFRLCNFVISLEEAEDFIRPLVEEVRK